MRLYVAVTSLDPLRAYLWEDGLCRLATQKYSTDPKHLSKRTVHLTNFSVNKQAANFTAGAVSDHLVMMDLHARKKWCSKLRRF